MNLTNTTPLYALIMFLAGMGIPIMAAMNANLSSKLQSPALATCILFLVGSFFAASYLFVSGDISNINASTSIPAHLWFAAVFVLFYILSVSWLAPKLGIGNAIALVLVGQLISMVTIDHFALFGANQIEFSVRRLFGLAFMIIGVLLTVRKS